ncbi:hypothetical protein [Deinococcus sonorensis]|uniref:Outer membrane protein beta-barrel domain-containing protein n=2 Tax=Deinococcus sonorensis TaxID=309891 RepID=A0AAU7U8F9_9DEIO
MKTLIALTAASALATAGAQAVSPNFNTIDLGLSAGYQGGLSGGVSVHARNVIGAFGLRIGADITKVNDALNDSAAFGPTGTWGDYKNSANATESGRSTTIGVDATYELGDIAPGISTYAYAGPRYNMYSATADFGSSGKTTYTTNQLGLGAGAVAGYAIGNGLTLTGDLGVDYYFPSSINSNDGAGNTDTFARGEAGYAEADALVNQPRTVLKAKLGIAYRF